HARCRIDNSNQFHVLFALKKPCELKCNAQNNQKEDVHTDILCPAYMQYCTQYIHRQKCSEQEKNPRRYNSTVQFLQTFIPMNRNFTSARKSEAIFYDYLK